MSATALNEPQMRHIVMKSPAQKTQRTMHRDIYVRNVAEMARNENDGVLSDSGSCGYFLYW